MKHYSLKPLRVALRPSPRLAMLLALAGLGSAVLLALLPLPRWLMLALCAAVLLATCHHLARDVLRLLPGSVVLLEVDAGGRLRVVCRNGAADAAEVAGDSRVGAWLTLLNLKVAGRRRSVLLTGDGTDAEDYRRLRVWLRWGQAVAQANPAGSG